jgi:hypothetical protein
MNRPDTLAEFVTRAKTGGEEDKHILMAGFLDNFYVRPERRQAMLDPEPELTGDPILDATIGGIASIWRGGGTYAFRHGPSIPLAS